MEIYGSIITRTGWTYEYVDDLCLVRALELLEFWRRENNAILRARGERAKDETYMPSESWTEISEQEAESQFDAMRRIFGVAASPDLGEKAAPIDIPVTRMPPELREAVQWAEEMKQKHGLN